MGYKEQKKGKEQYGTIEQDTNNREILKGFKKKKGIQKTQKKQKKGIKGQGHRGTEQKDTLSKI